MNVCYSFSFFFISLEHSRMTNILKEKRIKTLLWEHKTLLFTWARRRFLSTWRVALGWCQRDIYFFYLWKQAMAYHPVFSTLSFAFLSHTYTVSHHRTFFQRQTLSVSQMKPARAQRKLGSIFPHRLKGVLWSSTFLSSVSSEILVLIKASLFSCYWEINSGMVMKLPIHFKFNLFSVNWCNHSKMNKFLKGIYMCVGGITGRSLK